MNFFINLLQKFHLLRYFYLMYSGIQFCVAVGIASIFVKAKLRLSSAFIWTLIVIAITGDDFLLVLFHLKTPLNYSTMGWGTILLFLLRNGILVGYWAYVAHYLKVFVHLRHKHAQV